MMMTMIYRKKAVDESFDEQRDLEHDYRIMGWWMSE